MLCVPGGRCDIGFEKGVLSLQALVVLSSLQLKSGVHMLQKNEPAVWV